MLDKLTRLVKNVAFLWATLWATVTGSVAYLSLATEFVTANALEVFSIVVVVGLCTVLYSIHSKDHKKIQEQHTRLSTSLERLLNLGEADTAAIAALTESVAGVKLTQKQIRIKQVKTEVDLLFRYLRDNKTITEDEAKYIYEVDECRKELGVNSFTERKIKHLLSKEITYE